jgi:hypothetical protein
MQLPSPLCICPLKKSLFEAGHKVLLEVDDIGKLIVGDPWRILGN